MLALLASMASLPAAVPSLQHLHPVSVQAGSTQSVQALGSFDPWPPLVWVDGPGVVFAPGASNGVFEVRVSSDAPPGPRLVRMFNAAGSSAPRFFIVSSEPLTAEREPNDEFRKPQRLESLPALINGRLEKAGDVDCFSVPLAAGQTLVAALDAYVLGSPMDAVLRVVDERGVQVALNHDSRTLDPFLTYTAAAAGRYVVQVWAFVYPADSSVRFTGNERCIYRLRLSGGPVARYSQPFAVAPGALTKLRLFGWNLGDRASEEVTFDGKALAPDARWATLRSPRFEDELVLPVAPAVTPERSEHEPNDGLGEATPIELPGGGAGVIGAPGDVDRWAFTARKLEHIRFEVLSASLGFPLDAWLAVEDGKGKELARSAETVNADPFLEWTAPESAAYQVVVRSLIFRGGPDYRYLLTLRRPVPGVSLTVAVSEFLLEAGKTNAIKVAVTRQYGWKQKSNFEVRGLPDGVRALPVELGGDASEAVVNLVASPDAKVFSGPFQVVLKSLESAAEYPVRQELTTRSVNNGVPNGFSRLVIESVGQLWLTVTPTPPVKAVAAGK